MRDFRPLEAMRAVGELALSARHKAVLWALLTFVDREGRCWPSHATVAARAGVSKSTVKATLAELMRVDAVGSVERFRNHFLASGGPHAVKHDWDRAFINWVLRDLEEGRAQPLAAADAPPPAGSKSSTLPEGETIATGEALARLASEAARAASGARARMAHRLPAIERKAHSDAG